MKWLSLSLVVLIVAAVFSVVFVNFVFVAPEGSEGFVNLTPLYRFGVASVVGIPVAIGVGALVGWRASRL